MKVKDIVAYFEQKVPFGLAAPWDNIGLQCGDEEVEVKRIVVALDPSEAAINFAIKQKAQLLVTHHPLIFSPLKKVTSSDPVASLLMKMIKHDLNLLALHTNLDSIKEGVSAALLNQLGIKGEGVIQPGKLPETGFGYWGKLDRALSRDEFVRLVKERLHVPLVRVLGERDKVQRIGVCGGSGADLIPLCLKRGIEALVLGEIKYHPARLFENVPLLIIEVGHYESEKFILPRLKGWLEILFQQRGKKGEVLLFEETSPYKYYF